MKQILVLLLAALAAHAQSTNGPRTQLEGLECRTNTLVVKGTFEVGCITGSAGSVTIGAKESTDASTGQKAFGVAVVVRGRAGQDTSYVDYEELDSLLKALAQMSATPWSQTALPQVEVSYITKDGLRFASANARGNTGIEAVVQSSRACTVSAYLSGAQIPALRSLIENAKAKLDGIPASK
jgi:hypothetical protein